ncbi:cytochrome b-c1 complex subunit 1, mitochondrial [Orussus abietinus]|uniref:cytochrome b-c1 complex subunit 1, mitochondrial n=1 Tax=Orussus abietinus TaxID=222816 RepID=UPI0006266DCB|nr:cytochrome b-c1 complex subunit 1, mitochondrial [Orussus abietinus]
MQNGMRIICEYKPSEFTTIGFFLPAGAMYEMPEERGAALFTEHLLFRKTKCRTQEQLEDELESIGGSLAAVAMRDMFLFYGTAPSKAVNKIVELLADVVLNGDTCDKDVTTERFVILRELFEMESNYEQVIIDYLPSLAYQDTELTKSIYPESCFIRNMCKEHMIRFRKRLFKPCFMTMVCTGGTSLRSIQQIASHYFLGLEQDSSIIQGDCQMRNSLNTPYYRFSGSELRLRDDDEELGYVAVAVEGPGYENGQDHCALTVAKQIVGSWDMTTGGGYHNAPFLAHRAFKSDMCLLYKSFNIGWSNTGLWGCYFVCEKMKLEDMMYMLQREWLRLSTTITNKEVIRAVNQCRTYELTRVNDPVNRFFDIAMCLFRCGRYEPLQQRIQKYEKVTADMIRDVANKYIYDQSPAVVAVGRIENLPDYVTICSGMYSFRL